MERAFPYLFPLNFSNFFPFFKTNLVLFLSLEIYGLSSNVFQLQKIKKTFQLTFFTFPPQDSENGGKFGMFNFMFPFSFAFLFFSLCRSVKMLVLFAPKTNFFRILVAKVICIVFFVF